ncbi:killer cell lectin-like receptor subfamily F member 1 [Anolis sagrei]|uniref:killer cell lectin-like receptor subfamily F member 1 n=1 Tax=Anolis sagrei TaxID=38937 RepID=UPI003522B72C
MEDEEGYMALSPRASGGTFTHCVQTKRNQDMSKRLVQYKISLGILGAICVILGSAVIGLTIVAKNKSGRLNNFRRETDSCSRNTAMHLCEPFTESATCKLCPATWIEERGICYWISKDKKNWIMGYHDCSGKRAQMVVFQDAEEMTFIYGIVPEKYPVWIGLNFTTSMKSWTWIDGTTLNKTLLHRIQLSPSENGANCGVIKDNQARSEMCTAEFRWICEKEAILF